MEYFDYQLGLYLKWAVADDLSDDPVSEIPCIGYKVRYVNHLLYV